MELSGDNSLIIKDKVVVQYHNGYDASTNYGGKYDYITITTLGNSAYFGDMQTAARDKQGCGSAIRALFGGGASPGGYIDEIDYLTIASAGNGVDFGNLTAANLHNSGLSNSTRSYGEEDMDLHLQI